MGLVCNENVYIAISRDNPDRRSILSARPLLSEMNLSQQNATATPNPGWLASCLSVVLGALAGGVIWCFASVSMRFETDFLIVPLGFALGLFLRWQGFRGRWAIGCAVAATLLAFAYAQYLFAAVRIAQTLGLPLRDAMFKAGPALTSSIAWGNLHARELTLLAGGIIAAAAAAAIAWRLPARAPRT